ncbi:MAG: bifunctional nuclease family protein [Verrucomicrobia bacterium]|nr:MAG: bifunctional nuclease family protein [Verrucomicrobiota bacterium]
MKNEVIPVEIRALLPTHHGTAIFVGNDEKVFVIQVESGMGMVIGMFMKGTPKERPLTHDLMNEMFQAFGITVQRAVITELKNSTYYARLFLEQENELGRKIVELDARPSDSIALAVAHRKPIFVTRSLFDQVEDMSAVLAQVQSDQENLEDDDED